MNMETDALRWFQEVADGVTVTEVSELARVSQSGVSRALARLEDEVGAELLRRSGRVLRMTQAGAAFKRHVDALIHQLDDGLAAVQQVMDPESGTVTLAFDAWLGPRCVPSLVSGFRADHASVGFTLVPQHTETKRVHDRADIDLEVTASRPSPSTFGWHPIAREPLELALPAGHHLASRPSVTLASLAGENFVALRPGSSLREITDNLCDRAGFSPSVEFECDDLTTVHGFVAAGLGVAIAPPPQGQSGAPREGLRLVSLEDVATLEIGVAWALQARLLPAAAAFLAHVRHPRGDDHPGVTPPSP